MARMIDARDRNLTEAAEAQRLLALELHHRVRNNLQILASFLSLQADSQAPGPARRALEEARLRVSTLGLVHRLLYDGGELASVSTAALLAPVGEQIAAQPGLAGRVQVAAAGPDQPVTLDVAVPVALWLVEAAALLLDRGLAPGADAALTLELAQADDGLNLGIRLTGLAPPAPGDPLRRRLVESIARQLGGHALLEADGPGEGRIILHIPQRTLQRGAGTDPASRGEQSAGPAV
jgi:two-component sensor histidine kinase